MTDVIIIGSGPAGISAALTLQANNKNFIWFGKKELSAKIRKAEKIHNYPGLSDVSGEDFCNMLRQQLSAAGLSPIEKTVTGVYAMDDSFSVLCNNEMFESRTVIVATGVETLKTVEGEADFIGRGVSYCATCDGLLYRGKDIAILCTAKDLEHEIDYLASLARTVHLFPLYPAPKQFAGNVILHKGMPERLLGSLRLEKLMTGGQETPVDGMFFLKNSVSPSVLIGGIQMDGAHVHVDRSQATSLSGCFACGDCTGRPYQYAKAVGEGNVAAHSAIAFLAKH